MEVVDAAEEVEVEVFEVVLLTVVEVELVGFVVVPVEVVEVEVVGSVVVEVVEVVGLEVDVEELLMAPR